MDRLSVGFNGNLIPGKHAIEDAETVTSPKSSYESWPSAPAGLAHAENRLRLQTFSSSRSPEPNHGSSRLLRRERSIAGSTAPSGCSVQPAGMRYLKPSAWFS